MSDDLQCDVEVNPGVRCQRKLDHYGSHVAYTLPSTPDGREPTKERGDGTRESAYTRLLDYLRYVEPDLPSDGRKLLLTDLDLLAGKLGDGTPGPAREAALVEEACRLYDRGRARDFDTAPEGYKIFMREEIAPIVRMVLASGDSGGPREWRDLYSDWLDFTVTRMKAGEPAGTAQETCVAFERFAKGWLRAELGRAGTELTPHLERTVDEFGNLVADYTPRAAAPERREPAP